MPFQGNIPIHSSWTNCLIFPKSPWCFCKLGLKNTHREILRFWPCDSQAFIAGIPKRFFSPSDSHVIPAQHTIKLYTLSLAKGNTALGFTHRSHRVRALYQPSSKEIEDMRDGRNDWSFNLFFCFCWSGCQGDTVLKGVVHILASPHRENSI